MKRIHLAGVAILLLANNGSCVTTGAAEPSLNVQTQTIYVDRPVACVKAADVPPLPGALPARPVDARQALDLALAKILEWQGYGEKADPLLQSCSKP